ncbi:MAG: recombinase A [Armatimonadota bacterium]|nr:recombinase A [Armatimonadota bacterium]
MTLPHLRATTLPDIRPQPSPWSFTLTAGRLVEVTGGADSAAFTMACRLILDAQHEGGQAAWVAPAESLCFFPDVLESGIDLDALVVVRVPGAAACARVADTLVRSGAFSLVVVDTGPDPRIPTPLLARLASLAQRHHAALIFLTQQHRVASPDPATRSSTDTSSSLGSLISLRVRARRQRIAPDRFRCWLEVLKDKRRGPTWGYDEVCRGAPGMR